MDELFLHSFKTAQSIATKMEKIEEARIIDQLHAMFDAYYEQNRKLEAAERREERLRKRCEALKKQLKSSETTRLCPVTTIIMKHRLLCRMLFGLKISNN